MFDTGEMGLPDELHDQVRRIAPIVLAAEQVLPVPQVFHSLLPGGGLQRGWTTRVDGGASARALAWALLGQITTSGGWIAAVDVPGISLSAAREVGVAIERVLVVTSPDAATWSATIGALIGAVDVIVFGSPEHRVQPSEYRRMASRCRERGTVLVELGVDGSQRRTERSAQRRSPGGRIKVNERGQLQYDVSFTVDPVAWSGLGYGYGRLQSRGLDVSVTGRRTPGSGRRGRFELPADDGTLRSLPPTSSDHPLSERGVLRLAGT